jgi:hypothetical protein
MGKTKQVPKVGDRVKISKTKRYPGTIVLVDNYFIHIRFETLSHYEIISTKVLKRSASKNYQWTVSNEDLIK